MKYALIAVAIVVGLGLVVLMVGYALPVKHRGVGEATFKASPETLYSLITKVDSFTTWRGGLQKVEPVSSPDGKIRWRETSRQGPMAFVFETTEPNRRVVTRIDDKSLPFGGTWTYEIIPAAAGQTTLRITEDGEVYNPIFRFVSRYFMGYDSSIKQYLADVGRKVGG